MGSTLAFLCSRCALLIAVCSMSACTLEPTYHRPELPVASNYPNGPDYSSAAQTSANTELGWRDFLTDPKLQRLIDAALKNNRDLRIAILNVEVTRAEYGIARSALFPTLSVNGAAARGRGSISMFETGSTVSTAYEAYASVSWELDLFGKIRSQAKAAFNQFLASQEARRGAQILLISEVANQYLTVIAADETLRLTDAARHIAEESFRLTKLQFDTGTGSELDMRESEGVLEQTRAQIAVERRLRAQAEDALVLLVGAPFPADLPNGLSLDQQTIAGDVPVGLPSDLLTRRPDIMQAENQLIAANANIGAARAAFFPSISLTGLAGTVSPVFRQLFHSGTGAWGVQPVATLPIFTGGLNTANLDEARANNDIAIAQYEKTIQTAFKEVADALTARVTYEDQMRSENRFVAIEQRRFDLARLRYKNGVDSYLVLLLAQTDLNNAQLARVATNLSRLTNLVTLYQELGGGWLEQRTALPNSGTNQ